MHDALSIAVADCLTPSPMTVERLHDELRTMLPLHAHVEIRTLLATFQWKGKDTRRVEVEVTVGLDGRRATVKGDSADDALGKVSARLAYVRGLEPAASVSAVSATAIRERCGA